VQPYSHKTLTVGDIETHYLEAGKGPDLVLLHGGEYGASAETTWKLNMESLGRDFHVIAPDMLGFGQTDKIYSFSDPAGLAAVMDPSPLPIEKMVTICGNASVFKTEAQNRLENYSASLEDMEKIIGLLFHDGKWLSQEFVQERFDVSLIPGSWETLSATRLRRPGYERTRNNDAFVKGLASVRMPLLIMSCAHDPLNPKDWDKQFQTMVPGSTVHRFLHSAHEPQIEEAEEFDRVLRAFLLG
jgi:pimeloyl-ACP methyl ester carboxylesterase